VDESCLDAQRIVSETYDGAHVDPAEIQRARIHCASCEHCAAFVSTLAAVRRLPDPSAPETVIESALAKVDEERRRLDAEAAAAIQAAAEREAAAKQADATEPEPSTNGRAGAGPLRRRLSTLPSWAVYGGYIAAAAAALLVAGIVAVQGAKFIAAPTSESASDQDVLYVAPDSGTMTDDEETRSFGAEMSGQTESSVAYVTVGEWVYEFTGAENSQPPSAEKIGTTTSALDTSSAPRTLDVLAFGDPEAVIVTDGEQFLLFELVTRGYRGNTYALQSRAVTAFKQWPSLPERYPEPESDDGSPTFTRAGADADRVTIYTVEGMDPTRNGFAIAPGTPPDDPAAGNPNWTWWAPLPE